MLTYSELKKIAESRKILISEIAEAVDMTSTGFKRSIETESFPIGKVVTLCDMLQIQVVELFGVGSGMISNSGNIISRSTAGGDIAAGGNASEVLFLRQQIKEKDRQINELLNILKK